MTKYGYLIAALLILGLGTYILWPSSGPVPTAKPFAGTAPTAFTLVANGTTQVVTQQSVTLTTAKGSWEFAADAEKAPQIWSRFGIEVPTQKIIADVGEALLSGYGVDASRELIAADGSQRLRWGGSGDQRYLWNGVTRTLYAVPKEITDSIDGVAATPLIKAAVLASGKPPERIVIDGMVLVRTPDSGWLADTARNRPPFDSRVAQLMAALGQMQVRSFDSVPTFGLPLISTIDIGAIDALPAMPGAPGPMAVGAAAQPTRTVTIHQNGADGLIVIQGYPPQKIDPATLNGLRTVLAAFARNPLMDLVSHINPDDVLRFEFSRDDAEIYRLERRERPPKEGGFRWELRWPGGRESAADDVVQRIARALSDASVQEPRLDREALAQPPKGSLLVKLISDRSEAPPIRIALAPGELITASHRGRLNDDGALARSLGMEALLNDRLASRDASRVAKIQRQWHDETVLRQEVVQRSEGGSWSRSFPKTGSADAAAPVDGGAIDRLIRVLAAARMSEAKLVSLGTAAQAEADRALVAAPQFEIDVRFAAVAGGQASNDETDLDLSAAQDWGIALRRVGERWIGVDKDLGLRFTLDDDTVEELRRPLESGQIFPVVGSGIASLEIRRVDGVVVRLDRTGPTRWMVKSGTTAATPADPLAVRRYLRALGALRVGDNQRLDPRSPEPLAGEVRASIVAAAPTVTGDPFEKDETQTLSVLALAPDGSQPVHTSSNRALSRFPRGRAALPATVIAELITVDAATFAQKP